MTLLTCAAVRRRLAAFHDGELPIGDTIAIESHIKECPPCSRELRDLRSVADGLRLASGPAPTDDWTGLQPSVISRMRAEANESWTARTHRLFEDMHLVWIALASTAATIVCSGMVLSMLHFASPERTDSLAGVIAVMGAPLGSDLNPSRLEAYLRVPSVPQDGVVGATLAGTMSQDDLVLPISVIVNREGWVSDLNVLSNEHDGRDLTKLLDAISRSRLEPAQFGDSPIAVNLVWLLAHTTVKSTPLKGKIIS